MAIFVASNTLIISALTFHIAFLFFLANICQHCIAFSLLLSQPRVKVCIVAVPSKWLLGFMKRIRYSLFLQLFLSHPAPPRVIQHNHKESNESEIDSLITINMYKLTRAIHFCFTWFSSHSVLQHHSHLPQDNGLPSKVNVDLCST